MKKMTKKTSSFEIVPVAKMKMGLSGLVYGRSGSGKTTFASTWPKPLLLLDIREKGTDSIANVKGVDMTKVTSFDQIEDIYWFLKEGQHEYQTVVIDQLTAMQNLALAKALSERNKDETDKVSKMDFGNASGKMKVWLLHYRDLIDQNINVLFLAHDRTFGDPDESTGDDQINPSVGARLMPSVAADVNGMVSFIGNTFISERNEIQKNKRQRIVEYSMRLGPHAYYTTKMRTPRGQMTPETLVDPTYDEVVAIMRGEQKATDQRPVRRISK